MEKIELKEMNTENHDNDNFGKGAKGKYFKSYQSGMNVVLFVKEGVNLIVILLRKFSELISAQ